MLLKTAQGAESWAVGLRGCLTHDSDNAGIILVGAQLLFGNAL